MSNKKNLPKPPVFQEILRWSSRRPSWQRDALRRIISGEITQGDVEALEKLCRFQHDILEQGEVAPIAESLEEKHIPQARENISISLVSLGKMKNANQLPSDQTLFFGEAPGLTIIYGENGAGKSGYARVIKRACCARSRGTSIEPNAYSNSASPSDEAFAEAEFVVRNGGTEKSVEWRDNANAHPLLRQIFLFDVDCAGHYICQTGGATFTPFGLDVLQRLSNEVCDPIKTRLEERLHPIKNRIQATKSAWAYNQDTAVGKLLDGLNEKTNKNEIDKLTTWTNENNARLLELQNTLDSNTKFRSQQTEASAKRVHEFRKVVITTQRLLSKFLLSRLEAAAKEVESSSKLVAEAFGESFLAGTGGDVWKALWKTAREYSEKAAYADKAFPFLGDEAHCVLCQSKLDEDTKARLGRFDAFIKHTASQLAQRKKAEIEKRQEEMHRLKERLDEKGKINADLASLDEQDQAAIDQFIGSASIRLTSAMKAFREGNWETVPAFTSVPNKILRALEKNLIKQSKTEAAAADPDEQRKLEIERNELKDRKWLSDKKSSVLQQIVDHIAIKKLETCISETGTATITGKSSKLTQQFVTKIFCDSFEEEIRKLKLRTLSVKLGKTSAKKGVTHFGVKLLDAEKADIAKIASEGEKRCIALAFFLAELSQTSSSSALVFDDPVSSLDHFYKEAVAARLVEESIKRQIIIFTHDMTFLHELKTKAEEKKITPHYLYLEWKNKAPAYPVEGLPWDLKDPKKKLGQLLEDAEALKKNWNQIPNEDNKFE